MWADLAKFMNILSANETLVFYEWNNNLNKIFNPNKSVPHGKIKQYKQKIVFNNTSNMYT